MNHEHGRHECFCVNCGYTSIVDAYIKCNTLTCPGCGSRMRARETGEYRETPYGRSQVSRISQNNLSRMPLFVLGLFGALGVLVIIGKATSEARKEV